MDSKSIIEFAANVSTVIAIQAGKDKGYKLIAEMNDGSEVVLKKSGHLRDFVNIFDFEVNGNAASDTASRFCTFNKRAGVKSRKGGGLQSPIASFEVN